ncbi:DUF3750 domain-containing protein [Calothrix rhizosoleniae]|uniref:DUF3750 domain-containing protein n=1 Tax=Calothrix rhizosoleniae TaxID=888997 RepID=UPI000B4A4096|nr:DUF3750 domain-containing protein [Calothrix rhizosoleniae]
MATTVQLRAAKLPSIVGYIAVHYWFVVIKENQQERWEVWQNRGRCPESWGHLHKNLMPWDSGVGNGGSWLEKEWQGEMAGLLAEIIENSPTKYGYKYVYRYYPGPNSNTYVQWILNEGKANYLLSALGVGKDYTKRIGIQKYDQVIHFSLFFLGGFKFIHRKEFELHILGLTIGVKTQPFILKLPFNFRKFAKNHNG